MRCIDDFLHDRVDAGDSFRCEAFREDREEFENPFIGGSHKFVLHVPAELGYRVFLVHQLIACLLLIELQQV